MRTEEQTVWKLRIVQRDGRDHVQEELNRWRTEAKGDYRKILKVARVVAGSDMVRDPKKVKRGEGEGLGDIYEIRADKGHARVFFFYDHVDGTAVAVCTNTYWKTKASKTEQENAFRRAAQLRALWIKMSRS